MGSAGIEPTFSLGKNQVQSVFAKNPNRYKHNMYGIRIVRKLSGVISNNISSVGAACDLRSLTRHLS